jgi:exosortase/archaeosortase family protein
LIVDSAVKEFLVMRKDEATRVADGPYYFPALRNLGAMVEKRMTTSLLLVMLLLLPMLAEATTPDLLLINLNFTWTGIPFLPGPLTVSGSNVWQPTVGYIDAAGQLTRPNYVITGSPAGGWTDIGWSPPSPLRAIVLEGIVPGPSGVTGGFQFIGIRVSETPGTYTGASFQNISGPISTYGVFAGSGSAVVVAVPELSILRSFSKHIGGRQLNAAVNPMLQRVTAWGAAKLLGAKSIGIHVILPDKILEVQEWCSGVSAIKWLMLLALGLGLVSRIGLPWIGALVVAAALIGIETNILRVAGVGYGYEEAGLSWATFGFGVVQVVGLGYMMRGPMSTVRMSYDS